jgi:excisionase family DNA binding protein
VFRKNPNVYVVRTPRTPGTPKKRKIPAFSDCWRYSEASMTTQGANGNQPTRRRLLKLKAAAEYLSMSPWKLRQLIWAGKIPVVQDQEGGPFLVDVADLDRYVEKTKHTFAS